MAHKKQNFYPDISQSFGILGILILWMIISSVISNLWEDQLISELSSLINYLLSMGIPLLWLHRKRTRRNGSSTYNFKSSNPKTIFLLFLAVVAVQVGFIFPLTSFIPVPDFMKEIFLKMAEMDGIFAFLMIVVAAPILEEFIFRGIILDGLLKKYSPVKAILVSSVIFGIVHMNPWQFITAMFLGSLMGWVYYRTGKLSLVIIIHMINNFLAFLSMQLMDAETMMEQSLLEVYGGVGMLVLFTGVAILLALLWISLLRKEFNRENKLSWQSTDPQELEENYDLEEELANFEVSEK